MALFGRGDPAKKKALSLKKDLRRLVKQKKYADALRTGRKILEKSPHDNDVLFIVGGICYMQNKPEASVPFFERALEIGEYDTQVLLLKARAHLDLGQTGQCKTCCEKILEVDPKNRGVRELYEKLGL